MITTSVMETTEYKDAVRDLWYWQYQQGDSFNCKVFQLLAKADGFNKGRIALAWPYLFMVWTDWHSNDNDEYFRHFGYDV